MSPFRRQYKREPFQFWAHGEWQNGQIQTEVAFNVPKTKRLVIENISAHLICPVGQEIMLTQIRTSVNKVLAWHNVFIPKTAVLSPPLAGLPISNYSGGQQVRLYADPGTPVIILVSKNSNTIPAVPGGGTEVYISGYLLPVQSPSLAP
jgi:hypothetical protein